MMTYDPKLRECMAEIEGVLKKFDCGGFFSLNSKTHGEFKMCVETPSWSNIRFLKESTAVHVKLHAKTDHANTEATVAMLANMRDLSAGVFRQTEEIMRQIETQVKVVHVPFGGRITNEDR